MKNIIEDKQSIVLIGANGAGKTRMSVWIDENNKSINIHRISAQKSLNMPKSVSPTELRTAEEQFIYGTTNENKEWLKDYGKKNSRWGNKPEIHMLNVLVYENALLDYYNQHFMWGAIPLFAPGSNQKVSTESSMECLKKVVNYIIR